MHLLEDSNLCMKYSKHIDIQFNRILECIENKDNSLIINE